MIYHFRKTAPAGHYYISKMHTYGGFYPVEGPLSSDYKKVKNHLDKIFSSIIFKDTSRHFRFKNPEDEAHFILLTSDGLKI